MSSRSAVLCLVLAGPVLIGCGSGTDLVTDAAADETPWMPPVPDIGTPGWRDSHDPWAPDADPWCVADLFCDVLPTPDGVFALLGWFKDGTTEPVYERSILFNDGTGWTDYYAGLCPNDGHVCFSQCAAHLAGQIDGLIVGRSGCYPGDDVPGTIVRVGPGVQTNWPDDATRVADVFVVGDLLAYAIWPGPEPIDTKIIRWDGATWSPVVPELPVPYRSVDRLWADDDDVFVVGDRGTVLSLQADDWLVHDVGTLSDLTAVWGFDGTDVWVGSYDGKLFHFDGSSWTEVSWPDGPGGECDGDSRHSILGMTGADGTLFFHGYDLVVRWDGDFTILGHWPGSRAPGSSCSGRIHVTNVRASAPDELFVAAIGLPPDGVPPAPCSTPFLLYWDGSSFHWM